MKQLRFERHCTERDGEFKQMMRMLFWEELERQQMEDARGLLQEQIYREFDVQIGAPRYGRSESRRDERNGHRIRSYEILGGRVGELRIPRAREMEIRFTVLEKWERVQPKVVAALLTAYLLGKSAAAGSMIAEAFGQSRFSRTYLQRLVRQFERRLKQWRERLIKRSWPYIFIDGMVVKVYEAEHLKEKVVIFAYGMDDEHRTELLGWVVADSEEEGAVRSLLIDLRRRGLQTPELFISDAAGGIRSALKLEYPHVSWQLCSFHKIQDIQENLCDRKHRKAIMREAGDIYQLASSRSDAWRRLAAFKRRWMRKEPEAVRLFARGFEHTLRYFAFPSTMWVSLRTNNPMEQLIGKLRAWLVRFNYFHGRANLDLALFSYVCYTAGALVSDASENSDPEKPTLFIA
ncbi:MAG: IS256 family transposase [Candidatus Aureabacteria bacterium]|nr:IS256 family transposase [Candidatus Auribacterota bacterium]